MEKANEDLVHHIILYECASTAPILGEHARIAGARCYSPTMPRVWDSCMQPVLAWARGSKGKLSTKCRQIIKPRDNQFLRRSLFGKIIYIKFPAKLPLKRVDLDAIHVKKNHERIPEQLESTFFYLFL